MNDLAGEHGNRTNIYNVAIKSQWRRSKCSKREVRSPRSCNLGIRHESTCRSAGKERETTVNWGTAFQAYLLLKKARSQNPHKQSITISIAVRSSSRACTSSSSARLQLLYDANCSGPPPRRLQLVALSHYHPRLPLRLLHPLRYLAILLNRRKENRGQRDPML